MRFTLPDVAHTLPRRATGSWCRCRARWFPLVDRNPQTFVDIYAAKETDFRAATQRVLRAEAPSAITVRIVRGGATL